MNRNISKQVFTAAKWSTITEFISKLISPITTMILARILSPEAFGVIATITMVFSFADLFTDAGFQKYLIQHEFKDDNEKSNNASVAFWTNLSISLFLWLIIAIFSKPIAALVGNPGLYKVIIVACSSLPLTSFSSIQMALYRRDFDFRTLFFSRIIGICIPFVVTIPLAFLGLSFWALIFGTISSNLSNAIFLTLRSKWKPAWFYQVSLLKEMISFSIWTLVEEITIWLTSWIDTFIVGSYLSYYYLGIYRTSISMVNSIIGIITGSTTTVLLSALSRLQNDEKEYRRVYFKFQQWVAFFVLPLGVGIYMYRQLITNITLGSQWQEASLFIGLWGFMSAITIIFSNYSSIVYISKGRPKLSVLAQILHLIVLVPTILISIRFSFKVLICARAFVRWQFIFVQFGIMYFVIKISPWKMIKNIFPSAFCSVIMGFIAYGMKKVDSGTLWDLTSIGICIIAYFSSILLFPGMRKQIVDFINPKLELIGQRRNKKYVAITKIEDDK